MGTTESGPRLLSGLQLQNVLLKGRGKKGISWGSCLVMGLAQPWERVSPAASSRPCMASCMARMDDNQTGSGAGGLHSCTAVLCDMDTNRGIVPLEPPPQDIWP